MSLLALDIESQVKHACSISHGMAAHTKITCGPELWSPLDSSLLKLREVYLSSSMWTHLFDYFEHWDDRPPASRGIEAIRISPLLSQVVLIVRGVVHTTPNAA